jgi:hypothetical protein
MSWLWKDQQEKNENSKTQTREPSIEELVGDESLRDFYGKARPIPPISLASDEIKKEYQQQVQENEQLSKQIPGVQPADISHGESEGKVLSLDRAAYDNCVEYEALLAHCSLKGTYWERLNLCYIYKKQQMKCVDLQREALTELGYNYATTNKQRKEIQNKVDDIFSCTVPDGPISERVENSFKEAVENEVSDRSVPVYRV